MGGWLIANYPDDYEACNEENTVKVDEEVSLNWDQFRKIF